MLEVAIPRTWRPARAFRSTVAFYTTKELGQGTGLGLSQVYGFVKQSGGHVKIYSEVGQGTTVKIYLPRLLGRVTEEDELDVEGTQVGAEESETILVVEDNTDVRAYLAEVLRSLNYRVITVPNTQAALDVLQQNDPIDLLLTDIVMPGGNGRELAKQAAILRPDVQILFMTGYLRNAVVHQGRLDEGVDLLQKPVSQAPRPHGA
jgi:CheY-like chemotaxis protein